MLTALPSGIHLDCNLVLPGDTSNTGPTLLVESLVEIFSGAHPSPLGYNTQSFDFGTRKLQ
jgi:hypothetical protein